MGRAILITGANGFIGRRLVSALAAGGWRVRACQRRPGADPAPPVETVPIGEIGPDTDWSTALAGIDVVLHLAGRAHQLRDKSPDLLAEYRRVNRDGSLRLARQAAAAGVQRLVFVSSVGVNGSQSGPEPFRETDPPNPQDDYALSKLEAEQGLLALAGETGLEVVIVRPPLVYGPDAPGNVARLLHLVASGWPLPLAGIAARRSFVSLDNLADFLQICLEHPAAAGELFLVADQEIVTLPELIHCLAGELGVSPRLWPFPRPLLGLACRALGRSADYRRLTGSLTVSTEKAAALLGWTAPLSFARGIRRMAAHGRRNG